MDEDNGALWDENQRLPVIRPPCESTRPQPPTVATDNAVVGGGDVKPIKFQLSADAKEFVPRNALSNVSPATYTTSTGSSNSSRKSSYQKPVPLPQESSYPAKKHNLQARLARIQGVNGAENTDQQSSNSSTRPQNDDQSDFTQNVVKRYNEYMQEIIVKPGRFDALARMLLDESIDWFGYSQVADAVVDAIVTQAIIERNFQYNGARLCSLLSAELDTEVPVFKNHLFARIETEYKKIEPDLLKYPSKVYGYLGFLAELYTQMGDADSNNILGKHFLKIIDVLVSSCSVESIKRVCQLLKLTGRMLDKVNKSETDAIMKKLAAAGFKTDTTHLVGSVITFRDQNWGEEMGGNPQDAVIDSSLAALPCLQSEAVQYGPDGVTLSKEESDFLHESFQAAGEDAAGEDTEDADDFGDAYAPDDDDEMDDEMEKGFLEFLIESRQIL